MRVRRPRGGKYSERHACQLVEQPRSTERYVARERKGERGLRERLQELARRHPRYGYRRITALLGEQGLRVNRKRVQRLWRAEGLKVPQKQRKRRRLGSSANSCSRRRSEHTNHVWSYDFVLDQTEDSRTLKWLPVVGEFTRECLTIEVERHMTGKDVARLLERLMAERGEPGFLRSDSGPECIARAARRWLEHSGVKTLYIAPGSPWENAYSETFNSRFRDELLNRELFTSLAEAKMLARQFQQEYNHHRPHSALGYRTPAAFAAAQVRSGSASLRLREPAHQQQPTLISTGT